MFELYLSHWLDPHHPHSSLLVLSDRPRVAKAYLRPLLANICTNHGRDSPWEVNSDCITTIFCSDFSLNVSGHWGRQEPNGESNINKNAVCRTGETRYSDWGESTYGRRSNEAGAGNVRNHPHIQLLHPDNYGRALTFIFSPFFSLTSFRLDLSGFLSSNADRLTANSTS